LFGYALAAPSYTWFLVAGSTFGLFLGPLGDSPLVMDYTMKESIGKALSLRLMGVCVGSLMSTLVLFGYLKNIDPIFSWGIMAAIFVLFSFLCLAIIKDPPGWKTNKKE
jgi:hypothetical protein